MSAYQYEKHRVHGEKSATVRMNFLDRRYIFRSWTSAWRTGYRYWSYAYSMSGSGIHLFLPLDGWDLWECDSPEIMEISTWPQDGREVLKIPGRKLLTLNENAVSSQLLRKGKHQSAEQRRVIVWQGPADPYRIPAKGSLSLGNAYRPIWPT